MADAFQVSCTLLKASVFDDQEICHKFRVCCAGNPLKEGAYIDVKGAKIKMAPLSGNGYNTPNNWRLVDLLLGSPFQDPWVDPWLPMLWDL